MLAQEIKESLRTLTPAELLELKRSVDALCPPSATVQPDTARSVRIEKAKQEIFTEYDSLLSELAK